MSRSTSVQRSPTSSPRLRPMAMARTKAAYSGSRREAARKSSVSSRDQGLSTRAFGRGGSTREAACREISSSRQAAVRAVRRTRWDSLAVAAVVSAALAD